MRRIVYTFAVGRRKYAESAIGLGRSLKLIGDTNTRVLVTDRADFPWDECFDIVLPPAEGGFEWLFMNKLDALERTDADQIIFLDGDSLAFKRLDDIFDYCQGKGICVQGELVNGEFWHIDSKKFSTDNNVAGIPKFNGGFIYYERTAECAEHIKKCFDIAHRAKEFGFDRTKMPINDEISISLAMALTGKGHLIPETMDFQNSATGLVGRLHLDVSTRTCKFICRRFDLRLIEPYVFHASRYINFFVYWRQLAKLERYARYERAHGFGYMSFGHKLQRSFQRRILKLMGKV